MAGSDPTSTTVRFESEHELVAFKPPGVSCELPGAADDLAWRATLERARGERLRLCHRLDRIARGLVLIARSAESAAFHARRMRERRIAKAYLVCVDGMPAPALLGTHRAYLRRRGRRAELVRSGGDPAVLELLAAAPVPGRLRHSHVVVRLGTGRFHQIRAMLAALGHPLSGDPIYGGSASIGEATPWLESAVLAFRPYRAEEDVVIRSRPHPGMARVAPTIEAALAKLAGDVGAGRRQRRASGDHAGPASTQ